MGLGQRILHHIGRIESLAQSRIYAHRYHSAKPRAVAAKKFGFRPPIALSGLLNEVIGIEVVQGHNTCYPPQTTQKRGKGSHESQNL
jgi:hypothetical protein